MTIQTKTSDLLSDIGRVESVINEICIASGLKSIALSNVVEFSCGEKGVVLGFTPDEVQIIIMGDYHKIKKGDLIKITGDFLTIDISSKLLGRIINPIGEPLDEKGRVESERKRYIESPAKSINERREITSQMNTGYMIIDSQIPIGLGQREIFIGEKKVHKSDVAMDIICNQTMIGSGVICIYVAIDAETSSIKRKIEQLKKTDALKNTIVVIGRSSDPSSLNYVAPMTAVSIAEGFASEGKDVLIVFDNLTAHAKVYRQISLLLNRAPGREAYPGDVFYLHARLLERCGAFSKAVGGGSITAIPLVETQGEEMTDYISTNLMSITDGHVLFRQALSNKGIQPAIDSGFSVSRIGGRVQPPLLRELADQIKIIIIRYHEVEKYMVFGTEIKAETLEIIELGKRIYQFFYQDNGNLFNPAEVVAMLYFIVNKYVLEWEVDKMIELRSQLLEYLGQEENKNKLGYLYRLEDKVKAQDILRELVLGFAQTPNIVHRIEKKVVSEAEKETIVDLLRDNGDKDVVTRQPKK